MVFSTVAISAVASCGGGPKGPSPLRQNSMSYSFVIRPEYAPPHAREDIHYTIQVLDKKTRQPIESGEGQLFAGKPIEESAPTGPQSKTWDGLTYGPEVGTYRAKLNYVVAGTWAVAIRFRRDSLHPLERIDWMQDVLDERETPVPTSTQPATKTP
jgi:hypothetical protein